MKKYLTIMIGGLLSTALIAEQKISSTSIVQEKASNSIISQEMNPFIDALIGAYHTNSDLRARVREQYSRHERVPQALAGNLPNVSVTGDTAIRRVENQSLPVPFGSGSNRARRRLTHSPKSAGLRVSQNIYNGGGTLAAVESAENFVSAGYYDLKNQEQTTLLNAVTAYMNVIFRAASVAFNKSNVKFLKKQLEAVNAAVQAGEKTSTDVAQARSRLAEGEADLVTAEGEVENAAANYSTVIGEKPGLLKKPSPLKELPQTREEVVQAALRNNPLVQRANFNQKQAESDTDVATSELLPKVDLEGNLDRSLNQTSKTDRANSISGRLRLTIPLYQQGARWSAVRQQAQIAGQRRHELEQAKKQSSESAIQAWESWVAARKRIDRFKAQVAFAMRSRDQAISEAEAGERAYYEVLDLQRDVLRAQLGLVEAERDEVVAQYSICQAMGKLTAKDLNLQVQSYGVESHYREVRNKLIGFGHEPKWDQGHMKSSQKK